MSEPRSVNTPDVLASILDSSPCRDVTVGGATYRIRKLTLGEAVAWNESETDAASRMTRLIGYALANDEGGRLLTDEQAAALVPRMPVSVATELFNAALDHSGLSRAAAAEIEGN